MPGGKDSRIFLGCVGREPVAIKAELARGSYEGLRLDRGWQRWHSLTSASQKNFTKSRGGQTFSEF
jgi:hypothetical protein